MEILLTILAVFVGYYLFKGLFTIIGVAWRVRKEYDRIKKTAEGFSSSSGFNRTGTTTNTESRRNRHSGKIFSQNEGEFVEFEEIKTSRETTYATNDSYDDEPWIEDVEFEEIKEQKQ